MATMDQLGGWARSVLQAWVVPCTWVKAGRTAGRYPHCCPLVLAVCQASCGALGPSPSAAEGHLGRMKGSCTQLWRPQRGTEQDSGGRGGGCGKQPLHRIPVGGQRRWGKQRSSLPPTVSPAEATQPAVGRRGEEPAGCSPLPLGTDVSCKFHPSPEAWRRGLSPPRTGTCPSLCMTPGNLGQPRAGDLLVSEYGRNRIWIGPHLGLGQEGSLALALQLPHTDGEELPAPRPLLPLQLAEEGAPKYSLLITPMVIVSAPWAPGPS